MLVRGCAALLLLGCASTSGRPRGAATEGSPKGDACDPGGKRALSLDLDRDGRPDVTRLFAKRRSERGVAGEYLSCKQVDLNHDGRKDLWMHYGPEGERTVEEMDLDFDGRVDVVSFWGGAKMVRQELDTDFDGRPDILRHFENDKLARVERDTNRDGRMDHREFYEGGVLDRIGFDDDGDGRVDRWERAPAPAEAASAAPPPPVTGPTAEPAKK